MNEPFDRCVNSVYDFLGNSQYPYLVIGGLASGVLGEPRLTGDFDVLLFLKPQDISVFLEKAHSFGFNFDTEKAKRDAQERLCFEMQIGGLHVDCLIAATAFEAEALNRRLLVSFGGRAVPFPSPEDFIIFKLLVGRPKDMLDARFVVERHANKLDVAYIKNWIETFSDLRKDSILRDRLKQLFSFP